MKENLKYIFKIILFGLFVYLAMWGFLNLFFERPTDSYIGSGVVEGSTTENKYLEVLIDCLDSGEGELYTNTVDTMEYLDSQFMGLKTIGCEIDPAEYYKPGAEGALFNAGGTVERAFKVIISV